MKEKIKQGIKIIFLLSVVLTMVMFWHDQYNYYNHHFDDYYFESEKSCPKEAKVAVIKIQGGLVTYQKKGDSWHDYEEETKFNNATSSERIIEYIEDAEKRDHIKTIIIEIDSYGGGAVASEEIMLAVKRATKPTKAVIRGGGVSGAYLIATGADKIYASEISDIGGIGVTMSYLDYSQKNKEESIIYQELSAGKFKDAGDPDKTLTEEERELLMRDIEKTHEVFIRRVAENRNMDIEKVRELADGSTVMGETAKEKGLIDEIGDPQELKNIVSLLLNIDPVVCVYR